MIDLHDPESIKKAIRKHVPDGKVDVFYFLFRKMLVAYYNYGGADAYYEKVRTYANVIYKSVRLGLLPSQVRQIFLEFAVFDITAVGRDVDKSFQFDTFDFGGDGRRKEVAAFHNELTRYDNGWASIFKF